MTIRYAVIPSIAALLAAVAFAPATAFALTMKECSAKFKAAQADGSAGAVKWNDFRKAQCGPDATAEPEASLNSEAVEEPEAPKTAAPKGVTFPKAISAKYAGETPGKGRMHTCVDSYRENKAANSLGGLKWIQKGGGYYSLCNTKLKG